MDDPEVSAVVDGLFGSTVLPNGHMKGKCRKNNQSVTIRVEMVDAGVESKLSPEKALCELGPAAPIMGDRLLRDPGVLRPPTAWSAPEKMRRLRPSVPNPNLQTASS